MSRSLNLWNLLLASNSTVGILSEIEEEGILPISLGLTLGEIKELADAIEWVKTDLSFCSIVCAGETVPFLSTSESLGCRHMLLLSIFSRYVTDDGDMNNGVAVRSYPTNP